MASRYNSWICVLSPAGIVGSNPTGGWGHGCLLCVLCIVSGKSCSLVQKSPIEFGASLCVIQNEEVISLHIYIYIYIYRMSQEECARIREGVPYVKVYRYNPKHLYPKLNVYGNKGQRKVGASCGSKYCNLHC